MTWYIKCKAEAGGNIIDITIEAVDILQAYKLFHEMFRGCTLLGITKRKPKPIVK